MELLVVEFMYLQYDSPDRCFLCINSTGVQVHAGCTSAGLVVCSAYVAHRQLPVVLRVR
jgi:hypothetical protein